MRLMTVWHGKSRRSGDSPPARTAPPAFLPPPSSAALQGLTEATSNFGAAGVCADAAWPSNTAHETAAQKRASKRVHIVMVHSVPISSRTSQGGFQPSVADVDIGTRL